MRAVQRAAGWWVTVKPAGWCWWLWEVECGFGVCQVGPVVVEWWG